MKTLYLLRHAKSDWGDPALDDFDRPLTPRGERSAREIGAYMDRLGLRPDLVLCSPAVRTQCTWDLVSSHVGREVPTEMPEDLYLGEAARILTMIQATPEHVRALMVIAHNPGIGVLAGRLATKGAARDIARMAEKYPTCALAEFRSEADRWAEVRGGDLVRFMPPRDLA